MKKFVKCFIDINLFEYNRECMKMMMKYGEYERMNHMDDAISTFFWNGSEVLEFKFEPWGKVATLWK